jgi:hypothetical protein
MLLQFRERLLSRLQSGARPGIVGLEPQRLVQVRQPIGWFRLVHGSKSRSAAVLRQAANSTQQESTKKLQSSVARFTCRPE